MPYNIPDRKQVRPLHGALVRSFVLGENAKVGDWVYIEPTTDRARLARANNAVTSRARGIIVAGDSYMPTTDALVAGQTVSVVVLGPVAGIEGMETDKGIFISSATAGVATQTAPTGAGTWTMPVGYPLATNIAFVLPQTANPVSNT